MLTSTSANSVICMYVDVYQCPSVVVLFILLYICSFVHTHKNLYVTLNRGSGKKNNQINETVIGQKKT